jgi:alkaline phosphatase D
VTVEGSVSFYNHDTETYIKADANPICVEWTVFKKCGNATGPPVSSGKAFTTSDIDFTVKVEAKGLQPFTAYHYQFKVCGSDKKSPVGRTKTAPAPDANVEEIKLAVFSCSQYSR